jgi:predicted metal-dependent phosphoesterase TrpH
MYIDSDGIKWYKGNLHTHTTQSDGRIAPSDAEKLYKDNGYDFIAFTDHWKFTESRTSECGILRISGCEFDVGPNAADGIYHIVGVGMNESIDVAKLKDIKKSLSAQQLIDAINASGGAAILAHPAWSLNAPHQIKLLQGLAAAEIYNSVSAPPWNCRPYSGVIIDRLATEQCRIPCVAVDDTHFYESEKCKSYVWVKADELTESAIITALKSGDFISSQAPFFKYDIKDGVFNVTCSPASLVIFFTDSIWVNDRCTAGENITAAKYTIKQSDTFVRVEITDADGNTAWSSPIAVNNTNPSLKPY